MSQLNQYRAVAIMAGTGGKAGHSRVFGPTGKFIIELPTAEAKRLAKAFNRQEKLGPFVPPKCARTACASDNATYCRACAHAINKTNPGLVVIPKLDQFRVGFEGGFAEIVTATSHQEARAIARSRRRGVVMGSVQLPDANEAMDALNGGGDTNPAQHDAGGEA